MPVDLLTLGDQRLLLVQEAHEPLAGGHQLQGPLPLLVVLDGVLDGPGLPLQRVWDFEVGIRPLTSGRFGFALGLQVGERRRAPAR